MGFYQTQKSPREPPGNAKIECLWCTLFSPHWFARKPPKTRKRGKNDDFWRFLGSEPTNLPQERPKTPIWSKPPKSLKIDLSRPEKGGKIAKYASVGFIFGAGNALKMLYLLIYLTIFRW
jgi:hypothetical protein